MAEQFMNEDEIWESTNELFDALSQVPVADELPSSVVLDCYLRATCCAAGLVYDEAFFDSISRALIKQMNRDIWKRFSER